MSRATLLAAADLLGKGWTQGRFTASMEDVPCFCVVGALYEVTDGSSFGRDLEAVRRAIDPTGETNATTWNDAPERTQAEVVATVRRAAEMVG